MSKLFEGLEKNDLKRLIDTTITIDKFVSKLGDDKDVMTVGFTVKFKEPAVDLMVFCEGGYEWVLDGDMSSGEMENGNYMVFVEMERSEDSSEKIIKLIKDICNLTDTNLDDWNFIYRRENKIHSLTKENLENIVPLTDKEYILKFPEEENEEEVDKDKSDNQLDAMLEVAGIQIKKTHQRDEDMDALRSRARLL